MNCIIIENDESSFLVLKKMLKMYLDIDSEKCPSTENLEPLIQQFNPSVIFLDLFLDGESGLNFLIKRSQSEDLSKIPVVITSGSSQMAAISSCLRNGADAYLIKPIQKDLLMSTILTLGVMK